VLLLVIVIGAFALWSFFEKQSIRAVEPAPLPKITLITADPRSPATAAWVRLLTDAEMQPTLVPLDKVEVMQGVVVLCDVPALPPALVDRLNAFIRGGGSIAVMGQPPSTPIGPVSLSADSGTSDGSFKFAEAVSPILARLEPGRQVWVRAAPVAFLKETPQMNVDARWSTNARAVIMHMERGGSRILWFGFDPNALQNEDRQLMLLLRTAFRWVDDQPISEGAVGAEQAAKSFTTAAREAAHAQGFVFSVDPLRNRRDFRVWMSNRGKSTLQNATVRIWLPPGVTRVSLGGGFLMQRDVTLTVIPEDGACLISVPRLNPRVEKVVKLEIAARRQPPK
jgi:hypothetical protein